MTTFNLIVGAALALFSISSFATESNIPDFSEGLTGVKSNATPVSDAERDSWKKMNEEAAKAAETGVVRIEAAPSSDVASSVTSNAYRLGSGDKIRLTVFGEEDLSGDFTIDGTGRLALPLIGDIQAGGKTLPEVERMVMKTLSTGYLVNPRVNIQVLNFRPFFILGEVTKPGSYPYVDDMTVINAVALAGGYTPRASIGTVLIKRANDPDKKEISVPEDTKIAPGDVIRVDERFF